MQRIKGLLVVSLVFLGAIAYAGVVWTGPGITGKRKVYTATITSPTNATQIGTTAANGYITGIVTIPGTGAAQPLSAWDCTVTGADGEDLSGAGATDRINTTKQASPAYTAGGEVWYPPVRGTLGISCSNMGTISGTAATVKVTVQE